VGQLDVPVRILKHEGSSALQHPGAPGGKPGGVASRRERFPASFNPDQPH
jgi:hypothetical protein